MTIRQSVLLTLLVIFSLLSATLYLSSRAIFLERFAALEKNEVRADLARLQNVQALKRAALGTINADWALWDESYAFLFNQNEAFARANLLPETFRTLRLNFIAFLSREGRPVWIGTSDGLGGAVMTTGPDIDLLLRNAKPLLADSEEFARTGLLVLENRPLLFAAHAIRKSTGLGPYAGTLIMGRWLTQASCAELSREAQLDLTFSLLPPGATPSTGQNPCVHASEDVLVGTLPLVDITGKTAALLSFRVPRDITREGLSAIHTHLGLLLFGTLCCCVLTFILLEKKILARLALLTSQVREASPSADAVVDTNGNDELTVLQRAINALLRATRHSTESYERIFRNNGTANAIIDPNGKIVLVNTEFERLAGQSRRDLELGANIATFFPEIRHPETLFSPISGNNACSRPCESIFQGMAGQRHVLASFSTLPDQKRLVITMQDITAQKHSQAQLLELSRDLERRVAERTDDLKRANQRLGEEIARRITTGRILRIVNDIGLALSSARDMGSAFSVLLNILCDLDPIDTGAAYVLNEKTGAYDMAASKGVRDEVRTAILHLGPNAGPIRIAAQGKAVYGLHKEFAGTSTPATEQLRGVGLIPIVFQDRTVAILNIASSTADEIPASLRSVLDIVAAQTGGAIVRIAAQEHSEQTSKELQAIFETSAVGIMHLSRDRHILKVNARLEEMTGYTSRELVGRHIAMVHVDDEAAQEFVDAHYPALLRGEQLLNLETRLRTKSGEIRWFKLQSRMIDADKLEQGSVWIVEDIQEARENSEALARYMEDLQDAKDIQEENAGRLAMLVEELDLAKQQAESANKMKSDFLANVSHEIRTPMNAIMGMTDIVLAQGITQEQRRSLTIVKNSAEELLDIINGVLDLSKIEAGQFELENRTFSLRQVVETTAQTLGLTAAEKGLDLICHLPPDLPDTVQGDPLRLRQILVNLLGNAVKFTSAGHVLCHCALEEEHEDTVLLHFRIADTGLGIDRQKISSIFDEFTQVDSSLTRVYGGTGLGLSISRKLTALMGGTIWVDSTPGRGSTFHFTARMRATETRNTLHRNLFEQAASALVLINHPLIRNNVLEHLAFWGISSLPGTCATGEEILHRNAKPDLAIVDLDFHDTECMRLLQSGSPLEGIPLLAFTHQGDTDVRNDITLPIRAVLFKPLTHDDLLRALAGLFNLRLNLTRQDEAPAVELREEGRQLDILLVEDVPTNRELAEIVLTKMGHKVHHAQDGLDALTLLGRHRYDLIFMDLQMPVMDGFTATEIIRACEQRQPAPGSMNESALVESLRAKIQGSRTPIIAMTAHAMLKDRQRCLDIGMDAYITKPLRLDELRRTLRSVAMKIGKASGTTPDFSPATLSADTPGPAEGDAVSRARAALATRYGLEDDDQTLPLFLSLAESIRDHLPDLRAPHPQERRHELRALAHSLKGMLVNMGLTPEAQVAKHLEELCATENPDAEITTETSALASLCAQILTQIEARLPASHEPQGDAHA